MTTAPTPTTHRRYELIGFPEVQFGDFGYSLVTNGEWSHSIETSSSFDGYIVQHSRNIQTGEPHPTLNGRRYPAEGGDYLARRAAFEAGVLVYFRRIA